MALTADVHPVEAVMTLTINFKQGFGSAYDGRQFPNWKDRILVNCEHL